ncbi:MAG TPA: BTAD domain-containing putative transcriptional regulator [Sphingomonas sp.]|nr:BTAD domain-containing putative transcriptional regulator [Sphingomonas sp.]
MAIRNLCVLGTLAIDAPGGDAVLRTRKAAALVAFLGLQPDRRARREQLAEMFWPRVGSEAARTSLRQLLAGLRKASAGTAPLIEGEGDWLSLAEDVRVDAVAFEAAAARGDADGAAEAIALYRGQLIADGLSVDSAEFDEWLDHERSRLCRVAVAAMERVAAATLSGGRDRGEGLAAAERAVALDPYNEHAHRLVMELQAASGRPDLALLHFGALVETLRRELQVAPDPETQALHDRLRAARRPLRGPPGALVDADPTGDASTEPPGALIPVAATGHGRLRSLVPAALIGMTIALLAAAAIGVHRWISPPPAAPKVTRLFPVAADPSVEQRPAIAPDGSRVVYTARLQDKANVDLYLTTIGDQTPVRLTTDPEIDDNAVWTPDGSAIAFTRAARDGHRPCAILVMSVPGGQERLAGHCRAALTSRLSWSPDGRSLYYSDIAAKGAVSRIYRLDTQSGAAVAVTDPPPHIQGDGEPQVSRDGRTLAYLRTRAWQSVEVEVQDLETGKRRALSHDGKTVWGLTWGANDQGLIFSSDRLGDTGLWWMARNGSGLTRLALGDVEYRALSYARNKDRLVFEALKDHASFQQVARDATPATPPQGLANLHTNLFDRFYTESPTGRIAFVSVRSGPENLWIAEKGRPPHQISFTQDVFYQEPAWSPDGKWIAYVAVTSEQSDIFLVSGEGGAPRAVTSDPAVQQSPVWSPDGRYLYFTSRKSGAWRIWRIDPFSKQPAIMVSGDGPRTVRPSPDGKWLYYVIDGEAGVRRRVLAPAGNALTGSEEMVVPALHPSDWRNWWLADGALFYARRSGGDPTGSIMRHDLASGAERAMADATDLLWSASFWARPDGSLVLTHRDLQIDVNGVDF